MFLSVPEAGISSLPLIRRPRALLPNLLLKPAQGIVANLEYARGESGSDAVIFEMCYAG